MEKGNVKDSRNIESHIKLIRKTVENKHESKFKKAPGNRKNIAKPDILKKDEFKVVKSNVKPRKPHAFSLKLNNPFKLLENLDSEEEIILVSTSLVKYQAFEFCHRNLKKRRHICKPGARLNIIENEVNQIKKKAKNPLIITMAGVNDMYVKNVRSEDIIMRYRKLMEAPKEKSRNSMIIGIIPRYTANKEQWDNAKYINSRLDAICKKENIKFINIWAELTSRVLFGFDGVHLNQVGNARLGRLLDARVKNVLIRLNPRETSS